MTFKWNKKICIEHIVQLKSPLEEMEKREQPGLSPLIQKVREIGKKFGLPKR